MFDEGAPFVEVKFFKYFIDFGRVDFSASILIKDKECLSEAFVVSRTDSFSPDDWDGFFGFLFGFGISIHDEISASIHWFKVKRYKV